jgi:hypothetical protein
MHLDDAASNLLKTWITAKLEKISDADSDVLADYVLALVKTDDPESVAKANCAENLNDFLHADTASFVDELYQAIATKSYDPSRPPLKPAAPIYQPLKRTSLEPPRLPNESRKRSRWHDWDREEEANGSGRLPAWDVGNRPFKQPRRGGRGFERGGGRHAQTPTVPFGMIQNMPPMNTTNPGMPSFDPNDPMATMLAMHQTLTTILTGNPNGTLPLNGSGFGAPPRPQRCRDYDTKGYCATGPSCPYDHSNDPFTVNGSNVEYDPNNSAAALLDVEPSRTGQFDVTQPGRGRGRGNARGRGGASFRGGGKRAEFSHIGPNRDGSFTSIVIEQIPDDKCDEQSVRDFFSEFGNIENINLQKEKKLAIVR